MRFRDFDLTFLFAEYRVRCRKANLSSLLLRPDPNCARSSNQRERIIADDLGRTINVELDRIVGKRPDVAEFVVYAQHDASGIGSIANEARIIEQQSKLRVDTGPGILLRDRELAFPVAFQAQVAPFVKKLLQLDGEGGIPQVRKLFPIRICLSYQLVGNVELDVIAIGRDDGLRESIFRNMPRPWFLRPW